MEIGYRNDAFKYVSKCKGQLSNENSHVVPLVTTKRLSYVGTKKKRVKTLNHQHLYTNTD